MRASTEVTMGFDFTFAWMRKCRVLNQSQSAVKQKPKQTQMQSNVQRFLPHFFRGVFGRARRYLD